jgi:hypothetical protein
MSEVKRTPDRRQVLVRCWQGAVTTQTSWVGMTTSAIQLRTSWSLWDRLPYLSSRGGNGSLPGGTVSESLLAPPDGLPGAIGKVPDVLAWYASGG